MFVYLDQWAHMGNCCLPYLTDTVTMADSEVLVKAGLVLASPLVKSICRAGQRPLLLRCPMMLLHSNQLSYLTDTVTMADSEVLVKAGLVLASPLVKSICRAGQRPLLLRCPMMLLHSNQLSYLTDTVTMADSEVLVKAGLVLASPLVKSICKAGQRPLLLRCPMMLLHSNQLSNLTDTVTMADSEVLVKAGLVLASPLVKSICRAGQRPLLLRCPMMLLHSNQLSYLTDTVTMADSEVLVKAGLVLASPLVKSICKAGQRPLLLRCPMMLLHSNQLSYLTDTVTMADSEVLEKAGLVLASPLVKSICKAGQRPLLLRCPMMLLHSNQLSYLTDTVTMADSEVLVKAGLVLASPLVKSICRAGQRPLLLRCPMMLLHSNQLSYLTDTVTMTDSEVLVKAGLVLASPLVKSICKAGQRPLLLRCPMMLLHSNQLSYLTDTVTMADSEVLVKAGLVLASPLVKSICRAGQRPLLLRCPMMLLHSNQLSYLTDTITMADSEVLVKAGLVLESPLVKSICRAGQRPLLLRCPMMLLQSNQLSYLTDTVTFADSEVLVKAGLVLASPLVKSICKAGQRPLLLRCPMMLLHSNQLSNLTDTVTMADSEVLVKAGLVLASPLVKSICRAGQRPLLLRCPMMLLHSNQLSYLTDTVTMADSEVLVKAGLVLASPLVKSICKAGQRPLLLRCPMMLLHSNQLSYLTDTVTMADSEVLEKAGLVLASPLVKSICKAGQRPLLLRCPMMLLHSNQLSYLTDTVTMADSEVLVKAGLVLASPLVKSICRAGQRPLLLRCPMMLLHSNQLSYLTDTVTMTDSEVLVKAGLVLASPLVKSICKAGQRPLLLRCPMMLLHSNQLSYLTDTVTMADSEVLVKAGLVLASPLVKSICRAGQRPLLLRCPMMLLHSNQLSYLTDTITMADSEVLVKAGLVLESPLVKSICRAGQRPLLLRCPMMLLQSNQLSYLTDTVTFADSEVLVKAGLVLASPLVKSICRAGQRPLLLRCPMMLLHSNQLSYLTDTVTMADSEVLVKAGLVLASPLVKSICRAGQRPLLLRCPMMLLHSNQLSYLTVTVTMAISEVLVKAGLVLASPLVKSICRAGQRPLLLRCPMMLLHSNQLSYLTDTVTMADSEVLVKAGLVLASPLVKSICRAGQRPLLLRCPMMLLHSNQLSYLTDTVTMADNEVLVKAGLVLASPLVKSICRAGQRPLLLRCPMMLLHSNQLSYLTDTVTMADSEVLVKAGLVLASPLVKSICKAGQRPLLLRCPMMLLHSNQLSYLTDTVTMADSEVLVKAGLVLASPLVKSICRAGQRPLLLRCPMMLLHTWFIPAVRASPGKQKGLQSFRAECSDQI